MEGIRRLRVIGRVLLLYGTTALVAVWLLCTLLLRSLGLFELFFLAAAPALTGGALLLLAWVLEGFLTIDKQAR